ncbi:hypothetical protein [uncultured Clostridium sp.]|uniref:hypothetical protein n=1 Tax=uncultured Clostridium sp. TaxID=59620 RepID=UPI003217C1BF
MNNILEDILTLVKNALSVAEERLYNSIRKGNELDIVKCKGEIKIYQDIITYIIKLYPQNSQEELMYYIKTLEKDRDMYKMLYKQTTKMVEDIQKEKKHLSDILNAKRVLD